MGSHRGFSLVEVLVAIAVLAVGVLAIAALLLSTARAVTASQQLGIAQLAAREKLEQLRGLAWTSDGGAVPVSDWSTDLTTTPPEASGGSGLGASPGDTLHADVSGFCDFLDARGAWVAGGTRVPSGAAWVRRWSIQPAITAPDSLLIQVLVVPVRQSASAMTTRAARGANGAWLTTIRTRRTR